ncbi:ABC transporter permease [soil metagenome]
MLMTILGSVIGGLTDRAKDPKSLKIVAVGGPLAASMKTHGFDVTEAPNEAAATVAVQEGKAKVGVVQLADKPQISLRLLYDDGEQLSQIGKSQLQAALEGVNQQALKSYLRREKVPDATVQPVKVSEKNVGQPKKNGADLIVGLLPYLIVIWAFYGGMSVASDLVAGEKEKNTLETLLITPVGRTQIVLGKLLALGTICSFSSFSSLVGLILFSIIKPGGSAKLFEGGIGVTPLVVLVTVLVVLPLVGFFASLLVALSTLAKTSREAQTYLSLTSFVIIMPAMFSQFIGLTDYANARWINLVPVLGTANNIRQALLGKTDFTSVAFSIVSSLVLAAIMMLVTVRLFKREAVLGRS